MWDTGLQEFIVEYYKRVYLSRSTQPELVTDRIAERVSVSNRE